MLRSKRCDAVPAISFKSPGKTRACFPFFARKPNSVVRYDKAGSYAEAKRWGGLQDPGDVEVAPDGTVYVADRRGSPPTVKRFDSSGKLLKTVKLQMAATAGAGAQFGIGVDPDCNLRVTNPQKRNVTK